MLHLNDGGFL